MSPLDLFIRACLATGIVSGTVAGILWSKETQHAAPKRYRPAATIPDDGRPTFLESSYPWKRESWSE